MVYILLALPILLLLIGISIYNTLIRKKNQVDNAFHSIDVQLKKRYDLIPQLLETVKGYMHYEKDILENLTKLRTQTISAPVSSDQKVELDNAITAGIKSVLISVENYPDLKASQNFLNLQGALNETEEQLAASRRFYNAAVTDYHNALQTFPSSMIAGMMGLKSRSFFTIDEEQRAVPNVSLN